MSSTALADALRCDPRHSAALSQPLRYPRGDWV